MSNINLYALYNNKRRKFGVSDSSRYRNAFVEAVNLAISDFNAEVFNDDTVSLIGSFNDVIDSRLTSFTSITFDNATEALMSGRQFWEMQYDIERKSDVNALTDTITDGASNVVIAITNNIVQVVGSVLSMVAAITDVDKYTLTVGCNQDGNYVLVNGVALDITYGTGTASTVQPIGTVSARVISSVSGLHLVRTSFSTQESKLMEWVLDEESTNTVVTDSINGLEGTIADPVWDNYWVENSLNLDQRYLQYFNAAVEYYLQDGGEWAMEPDVALERKWFGRGLQMARACYNQNSTYTNPLNI